MTFGEIRIFFDNWECPISKRNVFNNDPVPVMDSDKSANYGKGTMLPNYLVYQSLDEFPGLNKAYVWLERAVGKTRS